VTGCTGCEGKYSNTDSVWKPVLSLHVERFDPYEGQSVDIGVRTRRGGRRVLSEPNDADIWLALLVS